MPVVHGVLDPWAVMYIIATLASWLDRVFRKVDVMASF